MAAMAPERGGGSSSSSNGGRTLHNFSLPPRLSWGTQKLLRCSNSAVNDASPPLKRPRNAPSSSHAAPLRHRHEDGNGGDEGNGIEVVREKLMFDLRSEVDKMRAVYLGDGGPPPPPPPPPPPAPRPAEVRPWNLRTRRAAFNGDQKASPSSSSPVRYEAVPNAPAVRDGGDVAEPRAKFSVALSKQEIEDDFVAMMGRRPPRKPKKRARYIQKQLDTFYPALWLSEITPEMYKVDENQEPPK